MFINKNNSKTKTAMNPKLSIFVFGVEAIIYLLLHNFHDCTFNVRTSLDGYDSKIRKVDADLQYQIKLF